MRCRNGTIALTICLILVLGGSIAGCSDTRTDSTDETEVATETTETTAAESPADANTEPEDTTEPEAAADNDPVSPVLGPTDANVSWSYLKDMYEQDGWWYVVVDYIQVTGPESDIQFVNQNPLLRTFPIASNAELQLLDGNGGAPDYINVTTAAFDTFQEQAGEELVQVTPQNGLVIKLTEWWSP